MVLPESPLRRLTDEQVAHFLAQRRNSRFPRGEKRQMLFAGGVFAGPFVLLSALIVSAQNSAPLWPILLAILLNLVWALAIGIGHKPITREAFEALPPPEQEARLDYESFWARLYEAGLGLFTSGALAWGAIALCFAQQWYSAAAVFIGLYGVCLLFAWGRRGWVARVVVEGPEVHRWVKPWWAYILWLAGSGPLVSGLLRLLAVTKGPDFGKELVGAFVVSSSWVLGAAGGILGIVAGLIARAQYLAWRDSGKHAAPGV